MANHRAIAVTSKALAGLIRDGYPRDQFGSGLEVSLYQPGNFEAPMQDGFSIFLFRVAINSTVRNMSPRRRADGKRFRPSLPLDLQFLVTPWAKDSERQQRMLGWVMRYLEDMGVLSAAHLNHYVGESDIFAATEGLEIICDPLSLVDYFTLWDRMRHNNLPVSITYTLRMLMIDSDVDVADAPLAQTRRFDMGTVPA